jgi:hypothetical protein
MTEPAGSSPPAASGLGAAIGPSGRALPDGYYVLTLVAVALQAGAEIHLRTSRTMPSVSLLELMVVPAFLCLVAEILSRPRLRTHVGALYRQNRALAWYAGYAALAGVAGMVRAPDTLLSFHNLFVGLALYALVALTIDHPARLRGVLAAALVGAMCNVGIAALQIGSGGPYPVPLSENVEAKLDLSGEVARSLTSGLFNHPNGLAMYLMPVVIFLLVIAWGGLGVVPRRRPLMIAFLVPALVILQQTYAKGVYAWLAAGAAFLFLPRRFERYRVGLAVTAVIGGILALTWFSLHAFLEGELVFGTIVSRIELWLATWNIVQSDPFVAVLGSGGPQLVHQPLFTIEYTNAHNAWLDQALTYGVPGLVLYLATYLTALRSLARVIDSAGHPTRAVALATFAALVAILGESFFEPTNHGVVFQSQLLLELAVAAVLPGLRSTAATG